MAKTPTTTTNLELDPRPAFDSGVILASDMLTHLDVLMSQVLKLHDAQLQGWDQTHAMARLNGHLAKASETLEQIIRQGNSYTRLRKVDGHRNA